jgi:hypothetical protein
MTSDLCEELLPSLEALVAVAKNEAGGAAEQDKKGVRKSIQKSRGGELRSVLNIKLRRSSEQ